MADSPNSSPDASFDTQPPPRRPIRVAAYDPNNPGSPNKPNKPFSKSAVKRDSVMALGSIEHLQQYFAKNGLAQRRGSRQINKMLVPALGPSVIPTVHVNETPVIDILPPSPLPPVTERPTFPPTKRSHEHDPEILKAIVIRDLENVEKAWGIGVYSQSKSIPEEFAESKGPALLTAANVKRSTSDVFDVLTVLQITTRAVRSVRGYLVSLPDDHEPKFHRDAPVASLRKGSQSRQRASNASGSEPVPFPSRPPDRLTRVRAAALDVLATLRTIEEANRIPLSDEAYDGLSVGSGNGEVPISMSEDFLGSSGRSSSTAGDRSNSVFSGDEDDNDSSTSASNSANGGQLSSSMPRTRIVPQRRASGIVQVWSDGEDEDEFREEEEKKPSWDERLVLGGGWLYNQVQFSSLKKEREVIARYLSTADEILFGGSSSFSTPAHSRDVSAASQGDQAAEDFSYIDEPIPRKWRSIKVQKIPRRVSSRSSLGSYSSPPPDTPARALSPEPARRFGTTGLMDALRDVVLSRQLDPMLATSPQKGLFELPEADEEGGSEGEEEEEEGELLDDELPMWAKREVNQSSIVRLHSILLEHIPAEYHSYLTPPSQQSDFMARLSDGQLLCYAYNSIVRRSAKPWGFIGNASVHDIIGLEEKDKRESEAGEQKAQKAKSAWTFRRTENLKLWAAALKLRYLIPLSPVGNQDQATSPPPSPNASAAFLGNLFATPQKSATALPKPVAPASPGRLEALPPTASKVLAAMGPPSHFDPRVIARRDDGWEAMFEKALTKWVDAVVQERRAKPRRR